MKKYPLNRFISFSRFIHSNIKSVCFFALSSSAFTACIKDDFDFDKIKGVEWSPQLAIPLVKAQMTFHDIIAKNPSTNIHVDSDHFCTFYYNDTLMNMQAEEMVQIKDQDVKYDFRMNTGQVSQFNFQGNFSENIIQHITFNPDEQSKLDSIFFKSGNLSMDIISTFKQNASIQILMPGLRKNGISFSKSVQLNYQGTIPLKTTMLIPLEGYMVDLTNLGSAVNDLTVIYKIDIQGTGNPISNTDMLTFDGHFKEMRFKSLFGFLGQQDLSTDVDTLNFNFFNSQPGIGTFTLTDPKLKVTINNSLGIPVKATIPNLQAYSETIGLIPVSSGIPNPLPVYSPTVMQIGQQLSGSFQLTNNNSNLTSLISHLPEYFIYQIGMLTNPDGNQSQNFITDTSKLSMYAEMELPLIGSAKDFVIIDTADFKMENMDQIEALQLNTTITNSFPIDLNIQLYFTDENYLVLDSLITTDSEIVKSGTVDIFTGKTTSPSSKQTTISLSIDRIQRILNAKKILTKGSVATTNQGNTNVKMFDDYSLGIQVGALAKFKVIK